MNDLPKFSTNPNNKCKTCIESKLARTSFKSIEKNTETLELIHNNISDLKLMQTRGGKKYFIIFINDCTRYYYFYLIRSKDEVIDMFKHYKNEVEN